MSQNRYDILDYIKAVAVILMILFHFCYDLGVFGFVQIQIRTDPFWYLQPKLIIGMFLLSVGMGLCLGHANGIQLKKFIRRLLKIVFFAGCISAISYYFAPGKWVYFGILHCIALSSLCALPFLNFPRISLVLGICLIVPSAFFNYYYPFMKMSHKALDHVAFLPWFGMVLIGIYLYSINFHKINIPEHRGKKFIQFLGRYSLEIYVLHQGVLFPFVYGLHLIFH